MCCVWSTLYEASLLLSTWVLRERCMGGKRPCMREVRCLHRESVICHGYRSSRRVEKAKGEECGWLAVSEKSIERRVERPKSRQRRCVQVLVVP